VRPTYSYLNRETNQTRRPRCRWAPVRSARGFPAGRTAAPYGAKTRPRPGAQPNIERILRNGVRGPSAGFCQGQAFLVLTRAELPNSGPWPERQATVQSKPRRWSSCRCRPSGSTSSSTRPLAEMIHYGQW